MIRLIVDFQAEHSLFSAEPDSDPVFPVIQSVLNHILNQPSQGLLISHEIKPFLRDLNLRLNS